MKPTIMCLMESSIDGRLHPSKFTESPDGDKSSWSKLYEKLHSELEGDAWIVGRVTMAEMSKGEPHPPASHRPVSRPHHFARRDADGYAIALDRSGKLHFRSDNIGGDHVVVLLGANVPDSHLAELVGDGVSYIVSDSNEIGLAATLDLLAQELGIRRLLLEGGRRINGSFFAAGLVDEFRVLVAPALDARLNIEGIVDAGDEGLAGKVKLAFKTCELLDHGVVLLCYAVEAE
ncbi:riboflavin deaminase [Agaricicola taiwanensis]|uniref:Riboflavin deaminase n=1 Tax=Agaricicola taiwanensis TaxID=591372 RepID=A0A8J2YLF8_9RHOB|nr:dihydrofolate reductase family protein [Agaricicola taiwanensis]GGE53011.1 riboflavin deaminase [Agaricicola taiwanensis]